MNMKQEKSDTNTKNTKVNKSNARKNVKKTDQHVVDKSRVLNDVGNLFSNDWDNTKVILIIFTCEKVINMLFIYKMIFFKHCWIYFTNTCYLNG